MGFRGKIAVTFCIALIVELVPVSCFSFSTSSASECVKTCSNGKCSSLCSYPGKPGEQCTERCIDSKCTKHCSKSTSNAINSYCKMECVSGKCNRNCVTSTGDSSCLSTVSTIEDILQLSLDDVRRKCYQVANTDN
uniref:Uncharacterized protein n=1 Tax=Ciona savignyi TaxID=51511 RepID=H2YJ75_CIOSA